MGHAQTDPNEKLALEYFNGGEYDKAISLYEKLIDKTPTSETFYKNLLASYKNTGDTKNAEKLIRRQANRFPKDAHYWVDLGQLYREKGDEKNAKKQFELALKELIPLPDKVHKVAGAFAAIKETDYAIATYWQGENYSGTGFYAFEITDLTIRKGDFSAAANKLLELLGINPGALSRIENLLSKYLEDNEDGPLQSTMKTALLKEIQKNPQGSAYSDLLLWLFVQQKNFDAAIVQAKSLDKRLKEDGQRLMELGQICLQNNDFDRAVKCYEYVVDKGADKSYYTQARSLLVSAYRKKITASYSYTQDDLVKLRSLYQSAYNDFGITETGTSMTIDYADLEAFYLNNPENAKSMLENLLANGRLIPKTRAEAKLKLADVLIVLGDMWEPALLYGQVDKEFKNDVLGQEAKFRGARLAYFRGDFELAQAQMKVLKASTSKLIANDALQLSLIIIDNLGRDSVRAPLQFFAKADLEAYQNNLTKAMETLNDLLSFYPTHSIVDEVYFKQAQILVKQGKFEDALGKLEKIYTDFDTEILADDALFLAAGLRENVFGQTDKAMELYEKIITEHTSSLYTAEARKRFRALRGDKIN